jgi:FKBP-type peptidyl-prolyl cis-trans isomerase SlyD
MNEQPIRFFSRKNTLRIAAGRAVRLRIAILDRSDGSALEFRDDLWYLHGGYGGAFPKIEQALEGLAVADRSDLTLDPEEGYGQRDEALRMEIPADSLPPEAHAVGTRVEGESGNGQTVSFTVVANEADRLVVDGNHPYAGRQLQLYIEVLDVREATPEELEQGYPTPVSPTPAGRNLPDS